MSRFQQNLFTCGQTYIHQGFACYSGKPRFGTWTTWCQDCFPPWMIGRKYSNETVWRVWSSRKRKVCLSTTEFLVWIEIISKAMLSWPNSQTLVFSFYKIFNKLKCPCLALLLHLHPCLFLYPQTLEPSSSTIDPSPPFIDPTPPSSSPPPTQPPPPPPPT